ncbi:unnamed protein product, partial [Amoebophrya sp. A120]|eukprot:GSA120T00014676001.1
MALDKKEQRKIEKRINGSAKSVMEVTKEKVQIWLAQVVVTGSKRLWNYELKSLLAETWRFSLTAVRTMNVLMSLPKGAPSLDPDYAWGKAAANAAAGDQGNDQYNPEIAINPFARFQRQSALFEHLYADQSRWTVNFQQQAHHSVAAEVDILLQKWKMGVRSKYLECEMFLRTYEKDEGNYQKVMMRVHGNDLAENNDEHAWTEIDGGLEHMINQQTNVATGMMAVMTEMTGGGGAPPPAGDVNSDPSTGTQGAANAFVATARKAYAEKAKIGFDAAKAGLGTAMTKMSVVSNMMKGKPPTLSSMSSIATAGGGGVKTDLLEANKAQKEAEQKHAAEQQRDNED